MVNGILPGEHNPIFTGSGTTLGSTVWPSATIAAWDSFIATATSIAPGGGSGKNSASGIVISSASLLLVTIPIVLNLL